MRQSYAIQLQNIQSDNAEYSVKLVDKNITIPDINYRTSILQLANMSFMVYKYRPDSLFKPRFNHSFGYHREGIRGFVFGNKERTKFIISFKGTSFSFLESIKGSQLPISPNSITAYTVPAKDRYMDNLMFACCCADRGDGWKSACHCMFKKGCSKVCLKEAIQKEDTYFKQALSIYNILKKRYPNSEVMTTGHSLGGAIASLVALKHDLEAVTFSAPGEQLFAKRIGLDLSKTHKITHIGDTSDPIYIGTCNGRWSICSLAGYAMDSKCHTGKRCFFDMQKEGLKPSIFNHRLSHFINTILKPWKENPFTVKLQCVENTKCEDCEDIDFY